jgi:hypothetical protein
VIGTVTGALSSLGQRFSFAGVLPFTIVATYCAALAAALSVPAGHSVAHQWERSATALGPLGAAAFFLVCLVLAVATEPLQIAVVRLVEGYWGGAAGTRALREIAVERQRRRWLQLGRDSRLAQDLGDGERGAALHRRRESYPSDPQTFLPTRLGNALRCGELTAGERYGLGTLITWPRILPFVPPDLRQAVSELHGQIDAGARLTVALGICTGLCLPTFVTRGWWNLVTAGTLAAAAVAYTGAVNAASRLNTIIATVFDLCRFDLIGGMHLPLPLDHAEELDRNRQLSWFLRQPPPQPGEPVPSPLVGGAKYSHLS